MISIIADRRPFFEEIYSRSCLSSEAIFPAKNTSIASMHHNCRTSCFLPEAFLFIDSHIELDFQIRCATLSFLTSGPFSWLIRLNK